MIGIGVEGVHGYHDRAFILGILKSQEVIFVISRERGESEDKKEREKEEVVVVHGFVVGGVRKK